MHVKYSHGKMCMFTGQRSGREKLTFSDMYTVSTMSEACTHTHMHACMHICMHTHTHSRTHTHTHTHIGRRITSCSEKSTSWEQTGKNEYI